MDRNVESLEIKGINGAMINDETFEQTSSDAVGTDADCVFDADWQRCGKTKRLFTSVAAGEVNGTDLYKARQKNLAMQPVREAEKGKRQSAGT